MPKLIMTRGLPGSGKSTWAKQQVAESGATIKRVNKDDLRSMIDAGKYSKGREAHILEIRDMIIKHYLMEKFDVIVDDTNISLFHQSRLARIADQMGAEFEIKSFLHVPFSECVWQDSLREGTPGYVGIEVIARFANEWNEIADREGYDRVDKYA